MMIGIFAIMLNEAAYVDRWAKAVQCISDAFDCMLVVDGGSTDGTVDHLRDFNIPVVTRPFSQHFANQRNYGLEQMDADWILEIDADEIPSAPLLGGLRALVDDAVRAGIDCIGIPRFNFIDDLLVLGPGYKHLDYQYRLHRRTCHWRGAVHEELVGYRARHELRIEDGHFLVHDKSSARYTARNTYYETLVP